MVHYQQALVVQYVSVVVVVKDHGGTPVISYVLDRFRVGYHVGALVEHVPDMVWVELRIHFWVKPVDQFDTMSSTHTVSTCSET